MDRKRAIEMKKNKKSRQMADDIMAGIGELEAMLRDGATFEDRFTVRTVSIPRPKEYSPMAIANLRKKLGMSQALFADLVGVSRILVQSWERGVREPSQLACRLLDTINRDPQGWLAGLHPTVKQSGRRAS
jgi:DNA-binding transcriptional regulator YiaG